jgi:hypothetical protein
VWLRLLDLSWRTRHDLQRGWRVELFVWDLCGICGNVANP